MSLLKGVQVLVVEDEADMREILSEHLKFQGAEVTEAEDGLSALTLMAQKKFHAVITDVNMPQMNGLELLKSARQESVDSPAFIVISGFSDIEEPEFYHSGAQGFFSKPFSIYALTERIRASLAQAPERWRTLPEDALQPISIPEVKFMLGKKAWIGRGGVTLSLKKELCSVGDRLKVQIDPGAEGSPVFEASGVCRWTRISNQNSSEILAGIEIDYLNSEGVQFLSKLRESSQVVCYIPFPEKN